MRSSTVMSRYSRKKNTSFFLNINSLTDMFTILLVFLLQTYSTADVELKPVSGLRLPTSNSEMNPTKSPEMVLTTSDLRLNDKPLAGLKNSDFESESLEASDSQFITPLFKALQEGADKNKTGEILLQADARLPYSVVRKVMYTASMAGFPKVRLVTTVGD